MAVFTKVKPQSVRCGIGISEYDKEGRCLTVEYEQFYIVCVYVPNSGRWYSWIHFLNFTCLYVRGKYHFIKLSLSNTIVRLCPKVSLLRAKDGQMDEFYYSLIEIVLGVNRRRHLCHQKCLVCLHVVTDAFLLRDIQWQRKKYCHEKMYNITLPFLGTKLFF